MALPVLYSFRRCPYAMRARLAIAVSGVAMELREIKLSAKPEALLEASPKGTVPVVVLPDERVLEQSLDVMHWALGLNDPEQWLERTDPGLISENDGAFKHALDRYKYPERHGSDATAYRTAGLEFLEKLDARLARHGQLCGDRRGLADMAIMPFVRQFAAVDRAWFSETPLPHLHRWLTAHLEDSLFTAVMVRYAPWRKGDAVTLFCGPTAPTQK